MIIAVSLGIIIFAASSIVAYIFFGVLQSSAETTLQNFKLGGAAAGFIATAMVLSSISLQIYKTVTTNETEKYREQVIELQSKLMRGTRAPAGYAIEVDEKHKIIFSRPEAWPPLNGVLYQYMLRRNNPNIPLNPNFNVVYQSHNDLVETFHNLKKIFPDDPVVQSIQFDPKKFDVEQLYTDFLRGAVMDALRLFNSADTSHLTTEFVQVDNNKSLKATLTHSIKFGEEKTFDVCQGIVLTYVPHLEALFSFTFTDSKESYLRSSEIFHEIFQSIRFLP